ncbi:Potassium voltage-gated channel subfamily A member 10 [Acanthosepion pharaonis]|uniref:Potassium voltage-gated channel subfamily A member 10 n=1 Tax=Acanthosepion pharaonis TaxID=158019 RepID=A0A812D1J7_ACAPH|nr:Potassium voltage-gated channel subfamily A member 10 [Sepia pharaonis]
MFCMDFEDKEDMNCSTRLRCKLWNILSNHDYSKLAKVYGFISLSFVIMSIFTFIAETHPAFKVPGTRDILGRHHHGITIIPNVSHSMVQEDQQPMIPHHALIIIDIVCLIFFTLEFVLRLTCAPKRVKFFFSFLNMVDLVALLPDYIEVIVINHVHNDSVSSIMHYITILRLIRILRIFRLIRHVSGLWVMMYTLKASLEELMLMCVFLLVGMVIFASLIFFVGEEQFDTIPISLWWALITMTTVGYGDMYPTKNLGYVVGTFCALAGLLMIGFTVPIIVNHFVLFYTHLQSALRAEKRQKIDLKEKEEELKLFAGREESQKEEVSKDKEIEIGEHADAPPSYSRFMDSLQKCKQNGIRKATDAVTDAELQYLSHSQAKVCENVDGGIETYNSLFQ